MPHWIEAILEAMTDGLDWALRRVGLRGLIYLCVTIFLLGLATAVVGPILLLASLVAG